MAGSKVWKIYSTGSTVVAAAAAKKALNSSWRLATGKNPPANPADPDVAMREAVAWAVASGSFIAIARMLAARGAAEYFRKSTGRLPDELKADGQDARKAKATAS